MWGIKTLADFSVLAKTSQLFVINLGILKRNWTIEEAFRKQQQLTKYLVT